MDGFAFPIASYTFLKAWFSGTYIKKFRYQQYLVISASARIAY